MQRPIQSTPGLHPAHPAHGGPADGAYTANAVPIAPRASDPDGLRRVDYRPQRRRWPGLLAVAVIAAGITAVVVSNHYDGRTLGQRVDAGIATAQRGVDAAAQQGAVATQQAAEVLNDAGITAAVKTALAADPALSALKINVDTRDGVVTLQGPAPDEKARERAGVLAAAPQGVRSVDNQLQLPG